MTSDELLALAPLIRARSPNVITVWFRGAPAALLSVQVGLGGVHAEIRPGHFGGSDGPKDARVVAPSAIELTGPPTTPSICIASRVKHASAWRALRDDHRVRIVSTWIDEAEPGRTANRGELVRQCLREAAEADTCVLYVDRNGSLPGEALGAAFVALHANKPVIVAFDRSPSTEMVRATGGLVYDNHGLDCAPGVCVGLKGMGQALDLACELWKASR